MNQIIYIVTAGNKSIEVWKLSQYGKMEIIQIINTHDNEGQPIKIIKNRNKLYLGIRPNYKILTYNILSDGQLKLIGESHIPYSPNYITSDQEEKFLLCAYYHAGCITISNFDELYRPNKIIQEINNLSGCHSININEKRKLIFIPSLLLDRIYIYRLDTNSAILPLSFLHYIQLNNHCGPRHMTLHNNKNYAYSINELNGTIDVWEIKNSLPYLKHIQNIHLYKKNDHNKYWSSEIMINQCGKYLYASDRLHNIITIFQIQENYTLRKINYIHTNKQPKSFIITPDGKYLICAGQLSNTIIIYKISTKNGLLNKLYEYRTNQNPTWITAY